MLAEVLVVEGKMDVVAINKALEAECIITEGFNLKPKTLAAIAGAYKSRGIIILTDPDGAGERIRSFLTKRFPKAKHAFVPKEEATANNDVGIEQASPEAIRKALAKVHTAVWQPVNTFSNVDMVKAGLNGHRDSSVKRAMVGSSLGIGYANSKTFLKRLNSYGITREEFEAAVDSCNKALEVKND